MLNMQGLTRTLKKTNAMNVSKRGKKSVYSEFDVWRENMQISNKTVARVILIEAVSQRIQTTFQLVDFAMRVYYY